MNTTRIWTRTGLVIAAVLLLCTFSAGDCLAGFLEDSSGGLRLGYFEPMNSSDSYDAVYGSGSFLFGLLWDWRIRDYLVLEGEYHHFAKSGERVNLVGNSWVPNGISEDLTYDAFLATAKYMFRRDKGTQPFLGAGLGLYLIDVSSRVGGGSFSKPGYHITAGALFLAEKKINVTAEARYSLIPSVLGDDPNSVSAYYGDSDAGGLALAVGVLYSFGN
jgi:opacity protein-like surface antigen